MVFSNRCQHILLGCFVSYFHIGSVKNIPHRSVTFQSHDAFVGWKGLSSAHVRPAPTILGSLFHTDTTERFPHCFSVHACVHLRNPARALRVHCCCCQLLCESPWSSCKMEFPGFNEPLRVKTPSGAITHTCAVSFLAPISCNSALSLLVRYFHTLMN